MTSLFSTAILISTMLLLTACTSKGSLQPDWVNGNASDYPAKKYLTGKGQDSHQAVARDRARADLAKIFEVSIAEQSHDQITYTSKSDGKAKVVQMDSETGREISTHTDQIVSGIQISETWKDPKSKQFHILATLDRMKAANSLRSNINQIDEATAQSIHHSKNERNPLRKLGHANKALQLQLERSAYQKHLKVVDYTGMGLSSNYNIPKLANDLDGLLQRIHIKIQIEADPIGDLSNIVTGALTNTGFSDATNSKPDYLLNTALSLDTQQDHQGWYWQRGTLELTLFSPDKQETYGSRRWSIKVSSQNKALSEKRVRDKINQLLNKELRHTLIQFGSAN
ncbi:MAG: LPP20 family lipoprotein [Gammaproteobacteria bacterium]|nr:LPP20 family lipoprotein [Gammaproteobacteria bacterium]